MPGVAVSARGTIEQQMIYLNFTFERQDLINGYRVYRVPKKQISMYPIFPGLPKDSIGPFMDIGGYKLRFGPTDPTGDTKITRSWTPIL